MVVKLSVGPISETGGTLTWKKGTGSFVAQGEVVVIVDLEIKALGALHIRYEMPNVVQQCRNNERTVSTIAFGEHGTLDGVLKGGDIFAVTFMTFADK